jgi:polyisoprenoid-binding protein YceI
MMLARHILVCLLTAALGASVRAAEQPLTVDLAQSRVEVAVKATADSFVAKLKRYDAAITIGDDGQVRSARFAFQFRDIDTGKEARDKAMHKWQQTDTYPEGLFVLSSVTSTNGSAYTAFGRLTFHGVTRDIQFPVTIARDGSRLAIDGDATIDTREFGLPVYRMLAVLKVDPMVHVRFHLQGSLPATVASTRVQP